MKKLYSIVITLLICIGTSYAQSDTLKKAESADANLPGYIKNPSLPEFNILLRDNATIFNTKDIPGGKPIALMLFSPTCSHCLTTISRFLAGIDSIQDLQFYLISPTPSITDLQAFCTQYQVDNYKNIKVVGRDADFFFINNYGTRSFPHIALYDKHKKFLKAIEGETTLTELYHAYH